MALREKLIYQIDLVTKGAQKGLANIRRDIDAATSKTGKFKAAWSSTMGSLKANAGRASLAAGVALTAFAAKAIGEASDLQESINAVERTYGNAARAILDLSEKAAEAVGLSASEFNGLAVQFSAFAKQVSSGSGQDIGVVIEDLTTRVADFASVVNISVPEAGEIFMSTLAGQTRPIRRYGRDVSAAAVTQYALANGLAESSAEMTEAIKVQARYALLMETTDEFAGDFQATQGELANASRTLSAEAKDVAASFGEDLIPAMELAVNAGRSFIDVIEAFHLDDLLGVLGEFDDAGTKVGHFFRGLADADAWDRFNAVDRFDEATKAAREFDRSLLDGLSTFAEVRQKVLDLGGAMHTANLVALDWQKTQDAAGGSLEDLGEEVDVIGEKLAANIEAVKANAEAQAEAEAAAKDHAEQLAKLGDEAERLEQKLQSLVGGDIAVRDAQRRAAEAVDAYREAMKAAGDESVAYTDSTDAAASALLAAAEAAASYQIDLAAANGEQLNANDKANLFRAELVKLGGQLEGPLKDQIAGYVADLANIPTLVSTALDLKVPAWAAAAIRGNLNAGSDDGRGSDRGFGQPSSPSPSGRRRHVGGPVAAGQTYQVLAGETFTPAVAGTVNAKPAATRPSQPSAAANYTIEVHTMTTSAETVRLIEAAIVEIERRRRGVL